MNKPSKITHPLYRRVLGVSKDDHVQTGKSADPLDALNAMEARHIISRSLTSVDSTKDE